MELSSSYQSEIIKYESQLHTIIKDISLTYPKSINSKEEKRRFFKALEEHRIYNPQFKFEKREYPKNILQQLEELKYSINIENDSYGIKQLLKEKIEEIELKIQCYTHWGTAKSGEFSQKIFLKPSDELLDRAQLFCKEFKREKIKFKRVTPQVLGRELQEEVKRISGNSIEVKYIELANKLNIQSKRGIIFINPNEDFKSIDIERLKVHEIGVHYRRYYNAYLKYPAIELFQKGTARYAQTEEGLAVYNEEVKGVSSKAQMYIYCGRVIATYYTDKMSFYELFMKLKEFNFKDSDAFALAFRAKRNICDTSIHAGYTRDYIYFAGYLKVKEYAKNYDVNRLMFGKIKIEDLDILKL